MNSWLVFLLHSELQMQVFIEFNSLLLSFNNIFLYFIVTHSDQTWSSIFYFCPQWTKQFQLICSFQICQIQNVCYEICQCKINFVCVLPELFYCSRCHPWRILDWFYCCHQMKSYVSFVLKNITDRKKILYWGP